MDRERASIFDDADFDLVDFQPKPPGARREPAEREAIQRSAERVGFQPREPLKPNAGAHAPERRTTGEREPGEGAEARAPREPKAAKPPPPPPAPEPRKPRRYVTGRNRQLNLKVTETAADRFYKIADANRLVLGEAFEMAVEALEASLAKEAAAAAKGKPA